MCLFPFETVFCLDWLSHRCTADPPEQLRRTSRWQEWLPGNIQDFENMSNISNNATLYNKFSEFKLIWLHIRETKVKWMS